MWPKRDLIQVSFELIFIEKNCNNWLPGSRELGSNMQKPVLLHLTGVVINGDTALYEVTAHNGSPHVHMQEHPSSLIPQTVHLCPGGSIHEDRTLHSGSVQSCVHKMGLGWFHSSRLDEFFIFTGTIIWRQHEGVLQFLLLIWRFKKICFYQITRYLLFFLHSFIFNF